MKHPIRNLLLLAILVFAVVMVHDMRKQARYDQVRGPAEMSNAERAEALRGFGRYKQAAELAEFYQALADHDFTAAREAYAKYDLNDFYWHHRNVISLIAQECAGADELLAALRDGYVPLIEPDSDMWLLDQGSNINYGLYFSLFGFEDTAALADACGASPDGKLLVLYAQTGEEPLSPQVSGEYGANLIAMASLGDALWPASLSEVEYILRVEYQMPAFSRAVKGSSSLRYRSATAKITLTHLTDGQVLFDKGVSGGIPDSVWVGVGAEAEKTYLPNASTLIPALNEALARIGAGTGLE